MTTPKAQTKKRITYSCPHCHKNMSVPDYEEEAKSQTKIETLKKVYEKAYSWFKLDWNEDGFVIWLEAEIKKLEGKK